MIFASDLDQTLIYSKRHIETLRSNERIVIEYKDGAPLSYMSSVSRQLLKELSGKLTFVPVTTRIMEQYKRIDLGVFDKTVPYAVISNGGRVLINGKDDPQWNDYIKKGLKDSCINLSEVLLYFKEKYSGDWVKSIRIAENLFIYCIVDPNRIPEGDMDEFRIWLDRHNWELSMQGRKIYFIPRIISKCKALNYLGDKLGERLFAGAGDSFLDYSFLKEVKYPVVPRHGELYKSHSYLLDQQKIKITENSGVLASDELLTFVLASINK